MNKYFTIIVLCLSFSTASYAANQFCATDDDFRNMTTCLLNETRSTCEATYPTCDIDSYLVDAGDPVSEMINICCKPGRTDAQWDACFLNHMNKILAAKSLPKKFRKHIKTTVLAYIANAELECTEH